MAASSFDRTSGKVALAQYTNQPYNNFRIQTQGGAIIQGQMAKIRVAELLFPYATPTVINSLGSTAPGIRNADNSIINLSMTSVTLSAGGTVRTDSSLGGVLAIRVPTGFYTGTELAAAIQAAINTRQAAQGVPAGTFTVSYDAGSGSIVWINTSTWNGADGVANYFLEFVVTTGGSNVPNFSQPNLLWTLGLRDMIASYPPLGVGVNAGLPLVWNSATTYAPGAIVRYPAAAPQASVIWVAVNPQNPIVNPPTPGVAPGTVPGQWISQGLWAGLPDSNGGVTLVPSGYPNVAGSSAPPLPVFPAGYFYNAVNGSTYTGAYTQYIDICSPTLCQAQNVRDGNTNQFSIHRDLICRLYIANEVSLFQTDPTGTRPFTIHRQFKNAKIMKWTVDRSIDAIDIQLYDQFGNPLPILPGYIDSVTNTNNYRGDAVYQGQGADFAITFLVDENTPELVSQSENVGYRY